MYPNNDLNGNNNPTFNNVERDNQNNMNNQLPNNVKVDSNYYGAGNQKTKEQIDAERGKTSALIAYLGPFVFFPYYKEKENPFVLYHVKQGLNLFIIEVIVEIIMEVLKFFLSSIMFWVISTIDFIVGLGIIIFSAIGMYYVLEGKMQEIPFISKVKIVK